MAQKRQRRFAEREVTTSSSQTTVIAEGMRLTGRLKGRGDVIISGELDSDCEIDGSVTLTDTGRCKGTIHATNVMIAGNLDGDVRATGKIEVSRSALVKGSLAGSNIAVAEGAVIEGGMQTTSGIANEKLEAIKVT